ncbi:MAG: Universal stress protein [Methanobacterium sp. PtaU1.Bin097]|jgi:nucleotide-binding universal stress UspA family protein|nr:MAG: Universal stress protein [Methanobacterium sp. PtaU1.Bin097]
MYEKILVATMGEYMDEILENTIDVVSGKEVEIIGIYVVDISVPFLTPVRVKNMMHKELTLRGREILNSMEEQLQEVCKGIKFKKVLLEGNPAEEIVKTAENENVDLIVMSTGKSRVDKHLLGSVSEKVVHSAPCSVLLVRIN